MKENLFVKIDEHENINKTLDELRKNLVHAKDKIAKLRDIKQKEDELLSNWEKEAETVQKNVEQINKILNEGE